MTNPSDSPRQPMSHIQYEVWALFFALIYPTILTIAYFQWLQQSSAALQQAVYSIGKMIQFCFPILYVILIAKTRSDWENRTNHSEDKLNSKRFRRDTPGTSLMLGIGFGVAVVIVMFLFYYWLLPNEVVGRLTEMVKEKVTSIGVGTPGKFMAVSLFYVIGHSFLEEYYWRWFVFNQLKGFTSHWTANLIAALGFMAHHVVLLGFFFGWDSPFTYALSASVAVGGIFWAWLFGREMGFRSAWLSHAIVDAGIFGLGTLILWQ